MSSDESDAQILSLAGFSESCVIDLGASFHATFRHKIFQNNIQRFLEKVYLGDDVPCNIIGNGATSLVKVI